MSPAALDALRAGALEILRRPLTQAEARLFEKYLDLLAKWQTSQRLIGSSDLRWMVDNLLLDSLLFLRVLPGEFCTILDVGSGAGLPGVPIKIVRHDAHLTLVESRRKRASFLATVARELELADTRVINARIEDVVEDLAGRFDVVVMRCAGRFDDLAVQAKRLLAAGGVVVASGPPDAAPLSIGEWVTVPSRKVGSQRRFAVYRSS